MKNFFGAMVIGFVAIVGAIALIAAILALVFAFFLFIDSFEYGFTFGRVVFISVTIFVWSIGLGYKIMDDNGW